MTNLLKTLFVFIVLVVIAFSFWARFAAPCEYFKYMPAREIPGRCLMR